MRTNITQEEATEMKARAIQRADSLGVVNMVKFMLTKDPGIPNNIQRSAPLPGAGLIIKLHMISEAQFTVEVVSADNPTARVLWYKKDYSNETYMVFREGSWVQVLEGFHEALKFRLANKDILEILKDFAPIEGSKEGENA